jgi:hypothetical protein
MIAQTGLSGQNVTAAAFAREGGRRVFVGAVSTAGRKW